MNGDGSAPALCQRFELRTATIGVIGMGYSPYHLSDALNFSETMRSRFYASSWHGRL
jgi:hypothetical protein